MLLIIFVMVIVVVAWVYIFMGQSKFGKAPSGERLERIKASHNYRDGKFQNQSLTPDLTEGANYFSILKDFFFNKDKRGKPSITLPSKKTDLHALTPDKNVLVWFGHSSYFMQVDGKKILVDPVFSGNASPLKFTTKSFNGADVYTTDDIPIIDYLFISHDHWDHLDHDTVIKLKPKTRKIITGLGTAAHLEHWGFDKNIIEEKDWNEEVKLDEGFVVNTTPARHFSGRGFKRQQALWLSFALQTPSMNIYIGGDSGYDAHFSDIGKQFGPFDLAILECGQYNKSWKNIHMMPEELVQAGEDLKAKKIMPVHWSKFTLALHSWDEPITRVVAEAKKRNFPIVHPMIGEEVNLKDTAESNSWWEDIK
ncbi:MAG TPA: MBL fold metallo-hydrolase [Ferruginibacter sp.]|nr:MBL fold metallo-hydrolase [Ferruginibacter sp.]